jgi:hypothetical protein
VEFKGANLWILIFAIFMASLGLNVNSTAVIIGAMLISPLMGPIMGVGLSVGLNDFELMKRSLKSFLITTAFSVTTATIFFLLAPIAEVRNQSCWHAHRPRFMTYSSHSSVDWQACRRSLYQGERKCDSGRCHCYRVDATALYGRLRTGFRQSGLLSWELSISISSTPYLSVWLLFSGCG